MVSCEIYDLQLVDNEEQTLEEVLRQNICWSSEIDFAVAFGSYEAFSSLKDCFTTFLRQKGKLRSIFDLQKGFTQKELLEEFATISGDSECKIYFPLVDEKEQKTARSFHPKMYLFKNKERTRVIIGSSNFTISGIRKNFELNLQIEADNEHKLIQQIQEYFISIWRSWYALPVDDNYELIIQYDNIQKRDVELSQEKDRQEMSQNLQNLVKKAVIRAKQPLNREIAYLWGLVVGAGESFLEERKIVINLRRQFRGKKDSNYRGYIYIEGISNFQEKIEEILKRDSIKIVENLNDLFSKAETHDKASYSTRKKEKSFQSEITIEFDEKSPYWSIIRDYIGLCESNKISQKPLLPEEILCAEKNIKKALLRGYFDTRARLSGADRYPNGPLRVALQLGTYAVEFGDQIVKILQEDFNVTSAKLQLGSNRGRDNLIRMNPEDLDPSFFSSYWQSLLLKDFQLYNQEHYGVLRTSR